MREIEKSKLIERGERVDRATETKRGEFKSGDTVVSAINTAPGGRASGGSCGSESPVGEKCAVCVGGGTEERESGGVVGERESEWERDEEERDSVEKLHLVLERLGGKRLRE